MKSFKFEDYTKEQLEYAKEATIILLKVYQHPEIEKGSSHVKTLLTGEQACPLCKMVEGTPNCHRCLWYTIEKHSCARSHGLVFYYPTSVDCKKHIVRLDRWLTIIEQRLKELS